MARVTIRRYSEAFKLTVVKDIEQGSMSVTEAKKKYGITGNGTVENWLKKLGREHLLPRKVRIESVKEVDQIKKLEKEKQELESALAKAHLKIACLETLVEVAEEEQGVDLKKKSGSSASKGSLNRRGGRTKGGR